jgi:hypothetical protein
MAWEITGNSGTNPNDNFLGTTDNQPLVIRTNGAERLRVDASGKAQSSAGAASALVFDEGSGYVGFTKRGTNAPGDEVMGLGNNASEIVSTSGNLEHLVSIARWTQIIRRYKSATC